MIFKETLINIIRDNGGKLSPQEIKEIIKKDYPQFYKTESHLRNIEKGHYKDEEHALLAQIYSLVRSNKTFVSDESTKPMKISLANEKISDQYLNALKTINDWVTMSAWADKVAEMYPDILEKAERDAANQKNYTTGIREIAARINAAYSGGTFQGYVERNESESPYIYRYKKTNTMTTKILELFDKYQKNPRQKWINNYESTINEIEVIKESGVQDFSEEFLKKLWLQQDNGIANVGQGILYKREFESIKTELPEITYRILQSPTSETFDEVINWAEKAKAAGNLTKMIRLVINRVFSSVNPDELCTVVNESQLDDLINVLNSEYVLGLNIEGNWFSKNKNLMAKLRDIGIEHEKVSIINTFIWQLYVWLVKKEELDSSGLSEGHVLKAIAEIDSVGIRPDEKSSTYDLIHNAGRYPPKLVYSLAHKYKDGKELDRSTFEGGENTQCFKDLRYLGFIIERKDFISELLKKFIQQADEGASLVVKDYPKSYCGLDVNVSFGQGNYSKVPWISLLGYGQKTQHGIYPVYLYYKTIKVLVLAYGVSTTNEPEVEWRFNDDKETIRDHLARKYNFQLEKYGYSYVYSSYQLPADLTDPQITQDLDIIIDEYHNLMGDMSISSPNPDLTEPDSIIESVMDPQAIAYSFSAALSSSNVNFGENHDARVSAFISSLMTKPLVILTGLSGSGKTQIAIRFGEWLGKDRMLVAPVRPDWTGAEALFGYEDALKPTNSARAAWAVPETLEFLLKAASDPYYPYLLVLDEMNLAHVERYFADVLSGMESNQPCLPNLFRDSDGFWRLKQNAADKIKLPNNVFIVGTVNVDETTYMFSPKVLDRANTFEFRVTADDLSDSYIKPIECAPGDEGLVRGFLEIGRDDSWQAENSFSATDELSEKMRQIHGILSNYGFEFGHRVFYESQRFAAIYGATGDVSTQNVLDLIIMQKLLPRLHGSRRRLEGLIRSFAEYCFNGVITDHGENPVSTFEPDNFNNNEAKLPISFDKLKRMLRSLRANQFTSFTE